MFSDSTIVYPYANASASGAILLYPGDSVHLTINCDYDTINLPYYSQDFKVTVTESGGYSLSESCKLFFTPYNSLEIWNIYEYYATQRVWLPPTGNPQRVYIPKSQIPISDITDSIMYTTDYVVALRYYDDLPYAVPFNMPDTFNYDTSNFSELKSKADGCGWGRKEFKFRVNGLRFGSWYDPNGDGNSMFLPLRNAKVELRINRWPDHIINRILKTNNDGYVVESHETFGIYPWGNAWIVVHSGGNNTTASLGYVV
jgi:hypothetical protein